MQAEATFLKSGAFIGLCESIKRSTHQYNERRSLMKRCLNRFCLVLILAGCCLQAQQGPVEQNRYEAAEKARAEFWKAGKYGPAVDVLLSLYNGGGFLDLSSDQRINLLYNLACGYSLLNDKVKAVSFLQQSLAAGQRDYYQVRDDSDFKNIRKEKEFQILLAKLKSVGDYGQLLKDHAAYRTQPEVSLPAFTYQAAIESELQELRRTYHLDEVAGPGDDVSRILNLMRWVHKTIRHDGNSNNPEPRNALRILDVCSQNKRGVNCRMLATVLNEVYLAMGFKSRHVTCLPKYQDDPDCHVIDIVYAESAGRWLYMDPSFEAYFKNEKGTLLSIAEVRESLIEDHKPILDKEANWNGEPTDPEWYLRYMSKNLFRFSCPAASEFGYESKPGRLSIDLEPADLPLKKNTNFEIHTTDAERFWSLPDRSR
jgi:hypothetical protein